MGQAAQGHDRKARTKRTEIIPIRFTKEEVLHLKKCAASFSGAEFRNGGKNFSQYLRTKLLAESGYRNQAMEQQLHGLRYELRKIGVNINQATKKINSGLGTPSDLRELILCLEEARQAFETYRKEVADTWQSQS